AVTSFEVAQRRRETGIRLALGSTTVAVRRRVLAVTIVPVAVGAAAGLSAALWALRTFPGVLSPGETGLSVLVLSAMGVVAVAAIAAWVPTRSVARVDPAVTLRVE